MGAGLQSLRSLYEEPRTSRRHKTATVLRGTDQRIFSGVTALVAVTDSAAAELSHCRFGTGAAPGPAATAGTSGPCTCPFVAAAIVVPPSERAVAPDRLAAGQR